MSVSDMFSDFIANLQIQNTDTISLRYGELTSALNKKFRDTESKTANVLQVGSFGRNTGIDGISDLDMLYIMPKGEWDKYKDGRQLKLLQDVKGAVLARYPATNVRVDRVVVTVTYTDFHIEIQPVFEEDDGSYKYPDTKDESSWKITKPREEMDAVSELDSKKNQNLKRLCKMARAWKNKHGLEISGLLIDTLAYNFLESTEDYNDRSFLYYDWMSRDFFKYLGDLEEQEYYAAPGSGQRVKVRKKFQRKARKAYRLCLAAIEAEDNKNVNEKWKKVYGRQFPAQQEVITDSKYVRASEPVWRNTEEFIEDHYPVDIRHTLKIDCEVKQNGFRDHFLKEMLIRALPLLARKDLRFFIKSNTAPRPYEIRWKILNRGEEAQKRDCIRGQIVKDEGREQRLETTNFKGDHVVECYAIKDGIVVAKDRIHVPITTNAITATS
jgi:Second Messenger Oligonucleotide or Dinucleotide Synthetase domain/Adenylyl/Guanylyl and SMODS C-terminal sensor domain